MEKKWDPLDTILNANSKALSATEYLNSAKNTDSVISVDTDKVIRWEFKDRPENELGDIDALADTFKTVGQQQPCIMRKSKKHPGKYELIVGERRWKAAEKAKLPLKAIVKDFDDKTAALVQAIENEKRKDISEFSKGMSYANKIDNGILTQKDLIDILHISKQQISRLLSYSKIPEALRLAIGDFRKVSSRTAYELSRLSKKSEQHLNILIEMADHIRDGTYGAKKVQQELERRLEKNENILNENRSITDDDGRALFTWKINTGIPSIHFSKDVANIIMSDLQLNEIIDEIKECIMKRVK